MSQFTSHSRTSDVYSHSNWNEDIWFYIRYLRTSDVTRFSWSYVDQDDARRICMMHVFNAECDANTFIISKVRKMKQLSSTIRQQVDVKGRRPVLLPTNFVHLRTNCHVFNRLDSIHHHWFRVYGTKEATDARRARGRIQNERDDEARTMKRAKPGRARGRRQDEHN